MSRILKTVWGGFIVSMALLGPIGRACGQGGSSGFSVGTRDMSVRHVDEMIYVIGPVNPCGNAKFKVKGRAYAPGCPKLVLHIPAHYRPVYSQGWVLTNKERLEKSLFYFQCVSRWLLGFIPITTDHECVIEQGPVNDGWIWSYEAAQYSVGESADIKK